VQFREADHTHDPGGWSTKRLKDIWSF
jgi:hypothetical protein